VNGRTVARRKPDDGPDTPYFYEGEHPWDGGHPFQGGNCRHLNHPPFTFKNIKWESGEIEAVGFIAGRAVARHRVRTPGALATLEVVPDISGKEPEYGEKDMLFVYVRLLDRQGSLCVTDNKTTVTLTAGGAKILSPPEVPVEAGIATFLLETGQRKEVEISAMTAQGHHARYYLHLR
jgi:beta-galactosidase